MAKIDLPAEWLAHDLKVKPYIRSHRYLGYARTAVGLAVMAWFIFSQRALDLEWTLNTHIQNGLLHWLAYFGVVMGGWKLLGMPFAIASHLVEQSFGLSKQTFRSWFWDDLKGTLLGIGLGSITLSAIYASVDWSPDHWWIFCCCFLMLFSIVLAQLAPVFLVPLFFEMKPLAEGPLKVRLLELCGRYSIPVKDVYHLGLGAKTEKGNAAFMGIGRSKRIVLGDTFYEKFPEDQIEAVFGHELGHQVHSDLWKGVGVGAVFMFLSFYLAWSVSAELVLPQFMTSIDRPLGLLLFFLVLTLVQIPFGVLQAFYSRVRENHADVFALRTLGLGRPLADALEKLTYQNWGEFKPGVVREAFSFSHPAPWRRILALRVVASEAKQSPNL